MKEKWRRAFTKVYEIFILMHNELIKKIANKFYRTIEEKRNVEYTSVIQEPLEKCKLINETIIILELVYTCSSTTFLSIFLNFVLNY